MPSPEMPPSEPAATTPVRPLLITADETLLDELLRLAAIAGAELQVAPDPVAARPQWRDAPLVIVGADLAPACVRARLPRRRDVALVYGRWRGPAGADAAWTTALGGAGAGSAAAPGGAGVVSGGGSGEAGGPGEGAWALASELGADQVIVLPDAEPWVVRRLTDSTTGSGSARVVAVVPGSGGAGASVLAAGLAITAVRQGVRPMLIDADPYGGGLDVLLGWEERDGLRWPELADAGGVMNVDALYGALPHAGDLTLLSWDRTDTLGVPVSAVDAVLDAGRRGSDLVIVDLPRRWDDAALRVLHAADLVLLVARPDVRSCAAAARVSRLLRLHCSTVEAVVRGPAPGNLRARDVCRSLGLPLAGALRPEPGLPAALDRGEAPAATGRGPLAALSRQLLTRLDVPAKAAA